MPFNSPLIIDDAFVTQYQDNIDMTDIIKTFRYLKGGKLPQKDLISDFGALVRANSTAKKVLFRKPVDSDSPKQEYWIHKFIDESERHIFNYQGIKFKSFDFNDMRKIVSFSKDKQFYKSISDFLHNKGINLIISESLPGTKIDGAARLTSHNTLAIGLTLRYDRLDNFFFTLLHELAHAVLHTKKLVDGIISEENSDEIIETEANRLAKDSIINPVEYRVCIPKRTLNMHDLISNAETLSIHPALLAGIIRKDLSRYDVFSSVINNSPIKGKIND